MAKFNGPKEIKLALYNLLVVLIAEIKQKGIDNISNFRIGYRQLELNNNISNSRLDILSITSDVNAIQKLMTEGGIPLKISYWIEEARLNWGLQIESELSEFLKSISNGRYIKFNKTITSRLEYLGLQLTPEEKGMLVEVYDYFVYRLASNIRMNSINPVLLIQPPNESLSALLINDLVATLISMEFKCTRKTLMVGNNLVHCIEFSYPLPDEFVDFLDQKT